MNKIRLILKINPFTSLYYSMRSKGFILIGWGSRVILRKGAKIKFFEKRGTLYIGINFSILIPTVVDIHENGILYIEHQVYINKGCKVMIGSNASLKIGSRSYINENSRIQCRKEITIGKDCAISWNCDIMDTDEHLLIIDDRRVNDDSKVTIGNKVWIGCKSTILKGSKIHDNCIIGANSLVRGQLKSNTIYAGNPIIEIKQFETWGSKNYKE
jgi:acetyltransferase-like isoleucine patch superfamily enzyme